MDNELNNPKKVSWADDLFEKCPEPLWSIFRENVRLAV